MLDPSYCEVLVAPDALAFEPALRADLLLPEEPLREALLAGLELPLREALDPFFAAVFEEAFFGAAFLGAAFLGDAFLILFFATALLIAFFGAAFLGATFFAPFFFAAAFLGALFFAATFFIPFLEAVLELPREEVLDADLLPRPALFEDFEPPRLEAVLLAVFDEDLPLPELLEADFFAAAFFFAFAIFNGF